ncbi:ABC transporter permease [Paraburkholderia sp. EG285A]|uniref:ABC transporter permease n=1 Tax=Paraburkholderia sp. EG285A TaxID=3237009 RepID=UPI0034D31319
MSETSKINMGEATLSSTPKSPLALPEAIMKRAGLFVGQVLVGLVVLAVWYLTDRYHIIPKIISRSPIDVFRFLVRIAEDGTLWPALYSTLEATIAAFLLASVVGVVFGVALGLFPRVEALIDPYLNALNAMPRIAFGPVFIIAFGIGQASKVALAFSIVVFVMMVNARSGVRMVDRDIMTMARVMNCSRTQMFFKILLPSAVPSIFAGLRLGLIYSLLGVITSEIIASRVGLGQLIAWYSGIFQLEGVYAVVLVLAVVASLLNMFMSAIERRLLKGRGVS